MFHKLASTSLFQFDMISILKVTQYNSVNIKLSDSQIDKLKSATKNKVGVTLRLSSNMIGNSNDGTNFSV